MIKNTIAVLIPCLNEGDTIFDTVDSFRKALIDFDVTIYVYDNNSNDNTVKEAERAGAVVRYEKIQGKGNVIRRMFGDVDAELYIIVDGDMTYDPEAAKSMISMLVEKNLDMVTGVRVSQGGNTYRFGHKFGNKLLTSIVKNIFGARVSDMLSGYRVFSRRFVKTFCANSSGFEIETELSVHALTMRMPIDEIDTKYFARPDGSQSKLNTYRDGLRILRVIFELVRDEKPLAFFGFLSLLFIAISFFLANPIISNFLETGLVPRIPTVILIVGLSISGLLSLGVGLILDSVSKSRREVKRLAYLGYSKNIS